MNYLHHKSYKDLLKGKGADQHSQCRLELLMTDTLRPIDYTVYVGATHERSLKTLVEIEKKIRNDNLGFGVYLGQRQFKAEIHHVVMYDHISYLASSKHLDTVCIQERKEERKGDGKEKGTSRKEKGTSMILCFSLSVSTSC